MASTKFERNAKHQTTNSKFQTNSKDQNTSSKRYDLEERSRVFAKNVALLCAKLPKSVTNVEYGKQIVRSSASIGANYLEANEALGKKDFLLHLRISRKEAKESLYWLRLILETNDDNHQALCTSLLREAQELRSILSSIIAKSQ